MLEDVTAYIDLVAATAPQTPLSSGLYEEFGSSAAHPDGMETHRDLPVSSEAQVRKSPTTARQELLSAVEGFLESALPTLEHRIELQIKLRHDLSELEYRPAFASNDPVFSSAEIASIFDKCGRQLLIVGAPGSGKTVLLLLLADALLNRARVDPSAPIPVPIFLHDTKGPEDFLSDLWAAQTVGRAFGLPESVAAMLVDSGEIVLLLDGLDEVGASHSLLRRIAAIKDGPGGGLAATCRSHAALSLRQQWRGVAELQPVDDRVAVDFLERLAEGQRWDGEDIPATPVELSLLAQHFRLTGSRSRTMGEAVEGFASAAIVQMADFGAGSPSVITDTFSSLARFMREHDLSVFNADDGAVRALFRRHDLIGSDVDRFLTSAITQSLLSAHGKSGYAFIHKLVEDYFATLGSGASDSKFDHVL
jgi:hypothetical protein